MASRRAISSWKTSSPLFISVTRSPRRCESSLVTRSARPSSVWMPSSRLAIAWEMRESPLNVDLMCGLAALMVSPSVVSAWESCGTLIASVVVVSSLRVETMS